MSDADAAPLSHYFNLPLLLDDPTPFSNWLKFPTLQHGYTFGDPTLRTGYTFGEPKLSNKWLSKEAHIPEISPKAPDITSEN